MNTKQENRVNMYLAVQVLLFSYTSVLEMLPNFKESFNTFKGLIAAIQARIEKQSLKKTGLTKSKQASKQNLAMITGDNARKLYAYALFINDLVLIAEVKIAQSKLNTTTDTKLIESAEGIIRRTESHLANLVPYQITEGTQKDFRKAIDNFAAAMPRTRLSKTEAKENTRLMGEDFKNAEIILEQIDALFEIIRSANPDLCNKYKQVRKLQNYGTHNIAVSGHISDASTHYPISGVSIFFLQGTGVDQKAVLLKKSAAKGGFNVKSIPEGTYEVKLSKIGYQEQTSINKIAKGEHCKMNLEMSQI